MPELPDITVCIERLQVLVQGRGLLRFRILNAFALRTAVPPISGVDGLAVMGVERLGKRIVLALTDGTLLHIHLLAGPHLFSGIGNAYSDEILHGAKLSHRACQQQLLRALPDRLQAAR